MTKERQKHLMTIVVLALAAALALAGKNGWRWPAYQLSGPPAFAPRQEPAPQDSIYAMLDAARAGDVNAYLACYTGQMKTAIEASVRESTPEGFAKYLRDSNAAIKGVAVGEPEKLSDREVRVRVEYIYQDRNEAQAMYLEKVAGGWKVARVDGAQRVKTLVPYGTPVQ